MHSDTRRNINPVIISFLFRSRYHSARFRTPNANVYKEVDKEGFFILFLERRNIFHYVITPVAAEDTYPYTSLRFV